MTHTPATDQDKQAITARLRRMVARWPSVSGYHLNPEAAVVEGIVQSLTRSVLTHGLPYCPCRDLTGDRVLDRPNICPCAHHHAEIKRDGFCRCVLFVRDDYRPELAYAPRFEGEAMDKVRSVRERFVTVYSTSWCYMSRRALGLLEKLGVPFKNIDIDRDEEAGRQVEAWNHGTRSVPTVVAKVVLSEPSTRELQSVLMTPGTVVMSCRAYVTSWCAQSRRAIAWLSEQGIDAQITDIERDPQAAERVEAWNGGSRSVPTLDITLRATEPSGQELEQMVGLRIG